MKDSGSTEGERNQGYVGTWLSSKPAEAYRLMLVEIEYGYRAAQEAQGSQVRCTCNL